MLNLNDSALLEKHLEFWSLLTLEQKKFIINNSNSLVFHKDQLLLSQTHKCLGLLFIKIGTLRAYIISDEGKELTLYNLENKSISILSASCILPFITFNVFLGTREHCEVIQIPPDVLKKINEDNILIEAFCYKKTAKILSTITQQIYKTAFNSLDRRLATFLIEETNRLNNNSLNITHEEIANHIGSSREVVSRTLKNFSNKEYIIFSRKNLIILNKNELKRLI